MSILAPDYAGRFRVKRVAAAARGHIQYAATSGRRRNRPLPTWRRRDGQGITQRCGT